MIPRYHGAVSLNRCSQVLAVYQSSCACRALTLQLISGCSCRPFGDLGLSLLATERLAVLYDKFGQEQAAMRQVRDMGVLLCHLQRFSSAQEALQQYEQWVSKNCPADLESTIESMQKAGQGKPVAVSKEEADVVSQLLLKITRGILERQAQ